jgi:hypothetical protein
MKYHPFSSVTLSSLGRNHAWFRSRIAVRGGNGGRDSEQASAHTVGAITQTIDRMHQAPKRRQRTCGEQIRWPLAHRTSERRLENQPLTDRSNKHRKGIVQLLSARTSVAWGIIDLLSARTSIERGN